MDLHYHAQCETCGKMVDFMYPSLTAVEEVAAASTGFVIHGHRLEVRGLCRDCANPTMH
ncbi:Peroxide operon regulator [compost metagenome]